MAMRNHFLLVRVATRRHSCPRIGGSPSLGVLRSRGDAGSGHGGVGWGSWGSLQPSWLHEVHPSTDGSQRSTQEVSSAATPAMAPKRSSLLKPSRALRAPTCVGRAGARDGLTNQRDSTARIGAARDGNPTRHSCSVLTAGAMPRTGQGGHLGVSPPLVALRGRCCGATAVSNPWAGSGGGRTEPGTGKVPELSVGM